MRKTQQGFTALEVVLVLAVLVVGGGIGYVVLHRADQSAQVASNQTAPVVAAPAVGTVRSIDSLTSQDAASESVINTRHTSSDQTTAQSTSNADANLGGAYDESTF